MKFELKINGSKSPKAGYIGWTPIKCILKIAAFVDSSPVQVIISTGQLAGAKGKIALYEHSSISANSTSAKPVETIEFDYIGEEHEFFVAGVFGHPSVARQDTFIRVEASDGGIAPIQTDVMVRVRKNANELEPIEIKLFLESFVELGNLDAKDNYADPNNEYTKAPSKLLDELVLMHTLDASSEIHRRTSFHPWHRAFLLHLERELQRIHPEVTIPYWKFDEPANNVFTTAFLGENQKTTIPHATDLTNPNFNIGYGEQLEPKFDKTNPLFTYSKHIFWGGALKRAYRKQNPLNTITEYIRRSEKQLICDESLKSKDLFEFWYSYEERGSHNGGHLTFTGHVVNVGKDPVDPLFFLMHSNVDRLWALWQHVYGRFNGNDTKTYPYQGLYNGKRGAEWAQDKILNDDGHYDVGNTDVGNYAEDTLWPWGYDFELSRPMRRWDTEDLGGDEKGKVPQINIKFPNSPSSKYPYPHKSLTVKSTIDYQGIYSKNNEAQQGFDYVDLPYFDKDKKTYKCEAPEIDRKSLVHKFIDKETEAPERLEAASELFLIEESEKLEVLEVLNDKSEETDIRLMSIMLADDSQAEFLDYALRIIEDKSEPVEIKSELIHSMVGAKRSNKAFPSRRAKFFDLLRGLLKDENLQLRYQAIEILTSHEDEVVQEFLTEELRKDQSEFISKQDAIFFLRENPKQQQTELFHDIFINNKDNNIRKAAIEALGNSPQYVELLKEVVTDERENYRVREAGGLSLHHLDLKAMNNIAAQLIAQTEPGDGIKMFKSVNPDPDEVDFKAGLLNMLVYTGDTDQLKKNEELKNSLREIVDPATENKANFLSSIEAFDIETSEGPTIVEQMAAGLLEMLDN